MPKVALREIDKFSAMIKQNFDAVKGGKSCDDLGKIMGKSKSTAWARSLEPLNLTLGELYLICRKEKVDIGEFVSGELKLRGSD